MGNLNSLFLSVFVIPLHTKKGRFFDRLKFWDQRGGCIHECYDDSRSKTTDNATEHNGDEYDQDSFSGLLHSNRIRKTRFGCYVPGTMTFKKS